MRIILILLAMIFSIVSLSAIPITAIIAGIFAGYKNYNKSTEISIVYTITWLFGPSLAFIGGLYISSHHNVGLGLLFSFISYIIFAVTFDYLNKSFKNLEKINFIWLNFIKRFALVFGIEFSILLVILIIKAINS